MNTAAPNSTFESVSQATDWLQTKIIGQEHLIQRLMMTLLCGGHLLVEGAPGLAKTRAIKELARVIEGEFHRIQFTPDLLPSDVTGTEIYRPEDGSFVFQEGPIFHNLILADEINRAPAKVQSALLEAMAEHQVSVGRETFPLADLFLVMATQNPIEQEGTYPLPEAQLDRFLMHVVVDYPDSDAERSILTLVRNEAVAPGIADAAPEISQRAIFAARKELLELHMSDAVERYLVALVMATRNPPEDVARWIQFGASPRATTFVTPEDVQAIAHDVLRHRLVLTFDADAQGISADQVIHQLIAQVPVP